MRVQRTSLFACAVHECRNEVAKPASLPYVSAPMLTFVPLDPPELGDHWEGRAYRVQLLLGGRLPIGEHTLDIEIDPSGPAGTVFHDAGYSDLVKTWDHRIILEDFYGMTSYTDLVEVRAGALTPVVWLFAWIFYGHRQRRWQELIASGFDYETITPAS